LRRAIAASSFAASSSGPSSSPARTILPSTYVGHDEPCSHSAQRSSSSRPSSCASPERLDVPRVDELAAVLRDLPALEAASAPASAADAIARFEHRHPDARSRQPVRGGEPCEARADDRHAGAVSRSLRRARALARPHSRAPHEQRCPCDPSKSQEAASRERARDVRGVVSRERAIRTDTETDRRELLERLRDLAASARGASPVHR
jgi:hypothetical protein